jgi:hypothetical protein
MLLHSLDGHFLPMKYPCGKGGLHIGLFKDFTEVFTGMVTWKA